ncbi:hypothetical protein HaLaN_25677 [Haematococcus lacustris]|uniref:Uncharacterized protein n=1 Tax=Haematococcus lacustris TaxID=44745 RepID=A0A6A0A0I0_HAELA|nr:hypothetical protein HaLaN_10337 [Haematococcus lacustris]GFH27370.1 hypothetical protein HaLaN_25677 [Haematococcus lacustris]
MSRLEQLGVCLGVDHPVFGKVKEELDKLKDSRGSTAS